MTSGSPVVKAEDLSYLASEGGSGFQWEAQPAPLWKAPISAKEIDRIEIISSDRLLVLTVEISDTVNFWGLDRKGGEVILLDASTGTPVWRRPRVEAGVWLEKVVNTGSVLLGWGRQGDAGYLIGAIDMRTGATLWKRKESSKALQQIISVANGIVAIGYPEAKGLKLAALRLETGELSWELTVPGMTEKQTSSFRLEKQGDDILVVGKSLAVVAMDSGRVRWSWDSLGADPDRVFITSAGKRLFVSANSRLLVLEASSGKLVWTAEAADAQIAMLSIAGNRVIMARNAPGGSDARVFIEALNIADGQRFWQSALEGRLSAGPIILGSSVFCLTQKSIVSLRIEDGSVIWSTGVPEVLNIDSSLPPHIVARADRLAVVSEFGIASYDHVSGKPLFAFRIPGTRVYSFAFSTMQLRIHGLAGGPLKGAWLPTAAYADNGVSAARLQVSMAELQGSRAQVIAAKQEAYQASVRAAGFQLGAAAISAVGQGISAAMLKVKDEQQKKHWALREMQLDSAMQRHLNALKGDFCVWPVRANGSGWILVDITTGTLRMLQTGLQDDGWELNAPNISAIDYDPITDRLYVPGVRLGVPQGETYPMHGFMNEAEKGWFTKTFQIPFHSIFCYQAKPLNQSSESTPELSTYSLREIDRSLFEAVMARDRKAAAQLLDSGANVNCIDENGFTPLMLACAAYDVDMASLLVARNVDTRMTDLQKWNANNWLFFNLKGAITLGMAPFLNAFERQRKLGAQ